MHSVKNSSRWRVGLWVGTLAFVFVALAMNANRPTWLHEYQLAHHGKQTLGVITGRNASNHETCFFTYTVRQEIHNSSAQGCHNPVGARILLTYLPETPNIVTTKSPLGELALSAVAAFICALVVGFVAAWNSSGQKS
jgi:hypothetical protein